MISFITFINLSIGKAKYEKGKISVPWELSLQSDHFFPDASKAKYALYRLYFCSLAPTLLIGAKFKNSIFISECLLAKNESVSPVNYWKVDLPDVNFDDLS